jgi:hypothetical protein
VPKSVVCGEYVKALIEGVLTVLTAELFSLKQNIAVGD